MWRMGRNAQELPDVGESCDAGVLMGVQVAVGMGMLLYLKVRLRMFLRVYLGACRWKCPLTPTLALDPALALALYLRGCRWQYR